MNFSLIKQMMGYSNCEIYFKDDNTNAYSASDTALQNLQIL